MKKRLIALAALVVATATISQADVVLRTDFTGFTTAETSISDFSWTSDLGEAANASTSLALSGSATGFINVTAGTGGTGPAVGVAGNVDTAGPWNTSFTFTPSQSLDITSFEISSYSISGGGSHQGATHTVDWELEITSSGTDFTGNDTQVEPGGSAPQAFFIDTTGTTLNAGTTYTFNLTVSNPTPEGGNNIALDMITLKTAASGPPNILDFSANPASVLSNATVTLSWNVEDATSLSIDHGIGDVTGMSSTQVVVNADTTYTLTATNGSGNTNETTQVTLITTPPVIHSFTSTQTIVDIGETVALFWNVTDETSLTLDPGGVDITGTLSTNVVINADITYTLTAANGNGTTNASVEIVIGVRDPLIAYYTFDVDGTATVGSDATFGDSASIDNVDFSVGAGSLALSAAGTTTGADGAVSGNSFAWASDERTVAFWVKTGPTDNQLPSPPGSLNPTIISLGSGTAGGNRFDIAQKSGFLRLEVQSGGFTTTTAINDDSWHHVAVVVPSDGATVNDVKYYIDGVYVANFSNAQNIDTGAGPLRMGDSFQGGDRNFEGALDDVRLYETALTDAEILALATIVPVEGDPVADLMITGPISGGTAMVLSWTAEDGKPYGVETNSNLIITADWQTFRTGLVGDGGTLSVTNTIGPDQTFYRVISE